MDENIHIDDLGRTWHIYRGYPLDGTYELRAQHERTHITSHWYARTFPGAYPAHSQVLYMLRGDIDDHAHGRGLLQWDPALDKHYLLSAQGVRDYCF